VAEGRCKELNNQDTPGKRTEGNNQAQGRRSQGQELQGNRGHGDRDFKIRQETGHKNSGS